MEGIIITDAEPEQAPAPVKQLNQKQLEALVFNLAVQADLDGNQIFYRLRREHGQTELQKKPVEELAEQMRRAWKTAPALARAKMLLDAAEISLTGDVMAALGDLELEHPRDVRDGFQFMRDLNQHTGNQLEKCLDEAIDFLEEADHKSASELRERFRTLYPEMTDA